ncbi:winged helix-turn-helix domain-containing protein [Streptomyces sp. NPDC000878]
MKSGSGPRSSNCSPYSPGTWEAVSRETLMAEVRDENWFGSIKTLDVTMAGLRRRLPEAATTTTHTSHPPRITTLRGHGCRLELRQVSQHTSAALRH